MMRADIAGNKAAPRIGILIPEFPGQTHIFFWRELEALRAMGIEPELASTRLPPRAIMSHSWSAEAIDKTEYLSPPSPADVAAIGGELAHSITGGFARVAASMLRAEGLSVRGRLRLLGLAAMGARLARHARQRGWRHVHVHSCADAAHVAMFAHLLSGLPYSITLHSSLRDYGPNQREKWRHARFAVVITRALLREVQTKLAGSLPSDLAVAPMGVDLQRFVRTSAYQPWQKGQPLRVFSCGRLNLCKGHGDLVAAIGILRGRGIDAHAEIAGEDEQGGSGFHRALEKEIADAGLSGAVTLLGAVSEDTVRERLEAAHVFSLASLAEPLGVAIMEAMALGVPVVVTGAGGVPELVEHNRHGLLVPPSSPVALADAIERVARDPSLARRLARTGHDRVVAEFSSDRSAQVLARRVRDNVSGASPGLALTPGALAY
jgi:colanic acid/amylovoran biosynthesis glycosyltransferase